MGFWGLVYAVIFLPAVSFCMIAPHYVAIGFIMLAKWLLFILPVRSLFPFGNDPLYFATVSGFAIVALYLFAGHMVAARLIMVILAFSMLTAYAGLGLDLINLHQSMIIADFGGYLQILVLYGGAGGSFIRHTFGLPPMGSGPGYFFNRHTGHTGPLAEWFQKRKGHSERDQGNDREEK